MTEGKESLTLTHALMDHFIQENHGIYQEDCIMNIRYKSELKPKRGDICPICKTEHLLMEFEVDAAKCCDCMEDEANFVHSYYELRAAVAHI